MGKNILIISSAETFTIKGLEMKLKGIGADSVFSIPKIKELEGRIGGTDLIILFTDDNIEDMAEPLVFLKDHCLEKEERIIVIGTKSEYEAVEKLLTKDSILDFYERPLIMDKLLDEVESYLSEDSKQARRKSILIVDDDVSYMALIMDWLKDTYRVSMANSGMQAITWLAKNHADLILLDYEMPVTNGPQVLEMIKSEAATADIPVMFLTGKNDKESIMKVLALKPVDYLLKTIDKQGLRDKLEKFFMSRMVK
ncbi:MAG: response regulator [Lachnospiraceae bacterium]|nr:response regulator [Lachnospiraceae bacterium]